MAKATKEFRLATLLRFSIISPISYLQIKLAERQGFEPWCPFLDQLISNQRRLTAPASFLDLLTDIDSVFEGSKSRMLGCPPCCHFKTFSLSRFTAYFTLTYIDLSGTSPAHSVWFLSLRDCCQCSLE